VSQAVQLAGLPEVRGLMDVSDGLARDLPRFLAPGTGAALRIHEQSLDEDVRRCAHLAGSDPLAFALAGGEDYALLGAVDRDAAHRLQAIDSSIAVIGEILPREGIWMNDIPLAEKGFDHFA
jgi:thiamine-monophosphate kinase